MTHRIFTSVLCSFTLLLGATSCSKKKMSDRDSKREQLRANAELKRQELAEIVGVYQGRLNQNSLEQDIQLSLEVKDVPDNQDGEIDPIPVPNLTGSLRLTFGLTEKVEFFSFAIQKGDFDSSRRKIDLTVTHSQFKEINLSLDRSGNELEGNWNAPSASTSGAVKLKKATTGVNLNAAQPELKGEYKGVLYWENEKFYQAAQVTISTSQDKPDGFSAGATIQIGTNPAEMLIYNFSALELNPLLQTITFKSETNDIYVVATYHEGTFNGFWFSKSKGRIGKALFSKTQQVAPEANFTALSPIKGTYYGSFTPSRSDIVLSKKVMLNITPHRDPQGGGNVTYSGNIRFYFGPYNSTEYSEFPCTVIKYDYYTRKIHTVCTSQAIILAINGSKNQDSISGDVFEEALGQIGTLDTSLKTPEEVF